MFLNIMYDFVFSTKKTSNLSLLTNNSPTQLSRRSHLFVTGTFRPRKGRIFHVPRVKTSNKGQCPYATSHQQLRRNLKNILCTPLQNFVTSRTWCLCGFGQTLHSLSWFLFLEDLMIPWIYTGSSPRGFDQIVITFYQLTSGKKTRCIVFFPVQNKYCSYDQPWKQKVLYEWFCR